MKKYFIDADGYNLGEVLTEAPANPDNLEVIESDTPPPYRPEPPKAPTQIQKDLTDAVQRHLDTTAKSRSYDGILSACSYAAVVNPFQAEGVAALNWRSAVWAQCYSIMAEVQAATRPAPTSAELIAELPVMVWP